MHIGNFSKKKSFACNLKKEVLRIFTYTILWYGRLLFKCDFESEQCMKEK